MFGNLIPWKKQDGGDLKIRRENDPISRLRQDFDQLWDRFWDDWRSGGLSQLDDSRWLGSRVDFDDHEKEYLLRAELPGFEPGDFDVKVSGNVLTLRAEHNEEGSGKKGNGSYRRYGRFYESFTLPSGVLPDQIDARYHSGVLEVHLPKSEECQTKRIAVKSA
jgi:HSP20 family protein